MISSARADDKPQPTDPDDTPQPTLPAPFEQLGRQRMRPLTFLPKASLARLAAFGGTCGPLVDAIHNQALLRYDVAPLELCGGAVETSWLVVPLLAVAYALLGGVLPAAFGASADSAAKGAELPGQPAVRALLAVSSTAAIIKVSEVLTTSSLLPVGGSVGLLFVLCTIQWSVLDGTLSSFALALAAALGGPLAEIPLMKLGAWHYTNPDYFPLLPLLGLLPEDASWSGLNYITAPCYFAVTTDAIALGRWFNSSAGGTGSAVP